MTFRAVLATKDGEKISTDLAELEEKDLMPGDVTISVDFSTVNYKDGVALTGRAPIFRTLPMIPGIDLSGTVEASSHLGIEVGDEVVANGWGLSQTHHGGYVQRAKLSGEWLVKIPAPLSTWASMAIGTAGYSAMLSVLALEDGGITPGCGDILVTGASGGVGSIAIALLSDLGYRVVASTGRFEEGDYLRMLGAADIIDRHTTELRRPRNEAVENCRRRLRSKSSRPRLQARRSERLQMSPRQSSERSSPHRPAARFVLGNCRSTGFAR